MMNGRATVISVLGLMLFLAVADAQEPRRTASRPDVPTPNVGAKKDAPPGERKAREDPKEAAAAAAILESAYEGEHPPEAVRMLTAVLRGSRMGPGEGWFGPAENRYSWKWLAERCGVDPAKGGISRDRFRGSDAWFARLALPLPQMAPNINACDMMVLQSPYTGGIIVGLGDGSVRLVSSGISSYSWNLALNPNDGQTFDSSW